VVDERVSGQGIGFVVPPARAVLKLVRKGPHAMPQ
jgi:hypothetical protein